jgi:hypothetical protein
MSVTTGLVSGSNSTMNELGIHRHTRDCEIAVAGPTWSTIIKTITFHSWGFNIYQTLSLGITFINEYTVYWAITQTTIQRISFGEFLTNYIPFIYFDSSKTVVDSAKSEQKRLRQEIKLVNGFITLDRVEVERTSMCQWSNLSLLSLWL